MEDPRGLGLLKGRLELATGSRFEGRGIAVVALKVHERGSPALPADTGGLGARVLDRLRSSLELVDTVAVIEPFHFVILLERLDDASFAVHVADRLVQAMREPFDVDGQLVHLVGSIGISLHPNDGETANELMACADSALQPAHLSGGDVFGFHSGPVNEVAGRRMALERGLVQAVEREELELYYQPQIDTRDGTLSGVEALLRWSTPQLGPVSPAEFIPILESTGAITRVGAWVLEQACLTAAVWEREGRGARVGVNLSAHQLRSKDLECVVRGALDKSGLDPGLLELELTEGVLVENPGFAREILDSLRRDGVRVAIDDFGTGYASLAYIRQFPMDTLKIDRQFVRGLPIDAESAAITSAIVALAGSLRLEVVAEGVETEAEEEFLHSLDCYIVQGYRHARPMSLEDFAEWRRLRPWA